MYQERTETIVSTELDRQARLRDLEAQDRDLQAKEDVEKKNPRFVQLTEKKMPDLRKHLRANPLAVEIFLFLSQHMGRDNILLCSQKVLVEEMGKSLPTVWRAIKYLKDNNLVETIKFGGQHGYALNGEYVWKTFNQPGRYAVFENAKALASKSENKAVIKKLATAFKNISQHGEEIDSPAVIYNV